jgi:hypothetical protein
MCRGYDAVAFMVDLPSDFEHCSNVLEHCPASTKRNTCVLSGSIGEEFRATRQAWCRSATVIELAASA